MFRDEREKIIESAPKVKNSYILCYRCNKITRLKEENRHNIFHYKSIRELENREVKEISTFYYCDRCIKKVMEEL